MQQDNHPSKEFKYCPFCGAIGTFVFDGNKKFKCEKCARSWYMNAAAAVGAIIETPKGILFVRRKFEPQKGTLDLPGGFADLSETAENAIARELHEELGFTQSDRLRFFATNSNDYVYNNLLYITLDIFFSGFVDETSNLEAQDDALSIEYIKPDRINIDEIGFESVKTIIKKYIANKHKY